ncbi:MAG: carboxypeptidase-like regulatory domain-containing protein [Rhodothermaceae bacterium]
MQRKGFIIFLLLFFPVLVFGQGLKIKGKVTDNNGEPLLGANVMLADLSIGAATDLDGNYVFDVPSQQVNGQEVVLAASYIGFKQKSTTVVLRGNTLEVNFVLEEDVFRSEEIVVTGIASRNSKSVAEVAVSRVSAKELTKTQAYQGISQLVAGKVSGVQVKASSGNVGAGFRFNVRGGGGLGGNGQPVIYIDGVRAENAEIGGAYGGGQGISLMAGLNVNDIENIEVLKGPAAAAMYGTGGSNGVVLITTKSGSISGASSFGLDYKFNYGMNESTLEYDKSYLRLADQVDDVYRIGHNQEHSLSVNGGTSSMKYYASFQKKNERGIVAPNELDRTSFRTNISAYPSETVTFQFRAGYNQTDITRPIADNHIFGKLLNALTYKDFSYLPLSVIESISDEFRINQFIGGISTVIKPIDKLEINASAGLDQSNLRNVQMYPSGVGFPIYSKGHKEIYERYSQRQTFDVNARYTYDILPKLTATSIVGSQILEYRRTYSELSASTFDTGLITQIGAATQSITLGETKVHTREAGIFTEHQLNYDNQYFVTLALRRDYANSIGTEAPAITYPKASFAVRLDKFNFLPEYVNLFKIRAAYGETGNLPGVTQSLLLLYSGVNGGHGTSANIDEIGNNTLEPERIKELEMGFEAELFNKLSLEFTYFVGAASNSIIGLQRAPSTGLTATTSPFNVGGIDTWGWETLVKFNPIRSADYDLTTTLIWNYANSEVTDLGGAQDIFNGWGSNVLKVGLPRSNFYAKVPTKVKYNTDGTYAGAEFERRDLGSPTPDHTGSFAINFRFMKNFNLYVLSEWGLNMKMFDGTEWSSIGKGLTPESYRLRALLNFSNGDPSIAPLTPGTPEYKKAAEEYMLIDKNYNGNFVKDADYFVLREVSLSYDFTELFTELFSSKTFKSFMAGISVRNLYRTSKYVRDDVELEFGGSRTNTKSHEYYTNPVPRTINFWFSFGF